MVTILFTVDGRREDFALGRVWREGEGGADSSQLLFLLAT